MKKLLLISLFITSLFEVVNAQYLPVLISNKTTFRVIAGLLDNTMTGKIDIQGDTTISGIIYKITWYQSDDNNPEIYGFTRQNAENSKLYYFDINSQTEYLVMNLDLEVGDEFSYINTSDCENIQGNNIAKVVSVEIIDGRKQLTFDKLGGGDFYCDSLKFIEGFGPNTSIFFQHPFGALAYKSCRKLENDVLSYPTSPIDFCGNPTNTVEHFDTDKITIAPNPFSNQLIIKTEINTKINIYTSTGILKFHTVSNVENAEINTTDWEIGIYYVLISGKYGSIVRKIVKL